MTNSYCASGDRRLLDIVLGQGLDCMVVPVSGGHQPQPAQRRRPNRVFEIHFRTQHFAKAWLQRQVEQLVRLGLRRSPSMSSVLRHARARLVAS